MSQEEAQYWFFNTNETHCKGAYQRMFARQVAAIYGYKDGGCTLMGAVPGDQIIAYVNEQGLRAVGTILDGVVTAGEGVFLNRLGEQQPKEFHLKVRWDAIVAPREAISSARATKEGYRLPVRCTFALFGNVRKAKEFAEELRKSAE